MTKSGHPREVTKAAAVRDRAWQRKHVSPTGKKEGFPGLFTEDDEAEELQSSSLDEEATPLFKKARCNKNKKQCGKTMFGGIVDPTSKSLAPAGGVENFMESKKMNLTTEQLTEIVTEAINKHRAKCSCAKKVPREQLDEIADKVIQEADLLKRLGQDPNYLKSKEEQPKSKTPVGYKDRLVKSKKRNPPKRFEESRDSDDPWGLLRHKDDSVKEGKTECPCGDKI